MKKIGLGLLPWNIKIVLVVLLLGVFALTFTGLFSISGFTVPPTPPPSDPPSTYLDPFETGGTGSSDGTSVDGGGLYGGSSSTGGDGTCTLNFGSGSYITRFANAGEETEPAVVSVRNVGFQQLDIKVEMDETLKEHCTVEPEGWIEIYIGQKKQATITCVMPEDHTFGNVFVTSRDGCVSAVPFDLYEGEISNTQERFNMFMIFAVQEGDLPKALSWDVFEGISNSVTFTSIGGLALLIFLL